MGGGRRFRLNCQNCDALTDSLEEQSGGSDLASASDNRKSWFWFCLSPGSDQVIRLFAALAALIFAALCSLQSFFY